MSELRAKLAEVVKHLKMVDLDELADYNADPVRDAIAIVEQLAAGEKCAHQSCSGRIVELVCDTCRSH